MLPTYLFSTKLERFNITFGDYDGYLGGLSILELKFYCNINSLLRKPSFRLLMRRSMKLYINRVNGLKNIGLQLGAFQHLKHLKIEYNSKIQYIIKLTNQNWPTVMLSQLKAFYFFCMENLENICSMGDSISISVLNILRQVHMSSYPRLKSLLSFCVADKLEMILVECYESMEKVVSFERIDVFYSKSMTSYKFPNLKRMSLMNLPKLIRMCPQQPQTNTDSVSTLFNKKVGNYFFDFVILMDWTAYIQESMHEIFVKNRS